MPTFDIYNGFCWGQTVCNAGSEASDNRLDANTAKPQGGGDFKFLRIIVGTAFAGLDSGMRVTVESDTVNTFNSTLREEASSPILLPARLTAGALIDIPLPRGNPDLDWQRYWRAYFNQISEVASAGTVTVGLV
jgi:hypothetical protein